MSLNSTIALEVTQLSTEQNKDILTVCLGYEYCATLYHVILYRVMLHCVNIMSHTVPGYALLQVKETLFRDVIFVKSGSLIGTTNYQSESNSITLTFSTDIDTNFNGWRVKWREIVPTTSTSTTTSTTTTPPGEY